MFKVLLLNLPHLDSVRFNREGRCQQRVSSFGYLMVPMSLIYIAALLRKNGFSVEVIDCVAEKKLRIDKFLSRLENINPKLIIIALSTPTFLNDVKIVELIKNRIGAHIAAIGLHSTVLSSATLSHSQLDSAIRGEPELASLELAQALKKDIELKGITGLSYRKNDEILRNPDRPLIDNLDILPFPARDLLNLKQYRLPIKNQVYTFIIPSRGCFYDCIFCQVRDYYGNKLRLRSIENIMGEIEEIVVKFGIRNIEMLSDNFTLDRSFVVEFCEALLERNLKIEWMANSRVDSVDYSLLSLMRKAGCFGIAYGVESGNQHILDTAQKKITIGQIEKAFHWSNKAGIKTLAQIILGLPGETKATIEQTLNFSIKINPDFAQFNCAVPFPGTKLYDLAMDNNWIEDAGWDSFELNSAIISTPELSFLELKRMRLKAYLKFYFRLGYLAKLIQPMKDVRSIMNILVNGIKFFKEWVLGIGI